MFLLISSQFSDAVSTLGFGGEDAQLTDGIQVKELVDEQLQQFEGAKESCGLEVLQCHAL